MTRFPSTSFLRLLSSKEARGIFLSSFRLGRLRGRAPLRCQKGRPIWTLKLASRSPSAYSRPHTGNPGLSAPPRKRTKSSRSHCPTRPDGLVHILLYTPKLRSLDPVAASASAKKRSALLVKRNTTVVPAPVRSTVAKNAGEQFFPGPPDCSEHQELNKHILL